MINEYSYHIEYDMQKQRHICPISGEIIRALHGKPLQLYLRDSMIFLIEDTGPMRYSFIEKKRKIKRLNVIKKLLKATWNALHNILSDNRSCRVYSVSEPQSSQRSVTFFF